MCSGSRPRAPKWKDPRQQDTEYLAIAEELGFKDKKGSPAIRNINQLYEVEKVINKRKEDEYSARLEKMETSNEQRRQADIARAEAQFSQAQSQQERQFNESLAAQQRALDMQIAAQKEAQQQAEELALRSQVPAMTTNSENARRVQAKSTTRSSSRKAALGTSQLRVPLGIQASTGNPVKLNIGS